MFFWIDVPAVIRERSALSKVTRRDCNRGRETSCAGTRATVAPELDWPKKVPRQGSYGRESVKDFRRSAEEQTKRPCAAPRCAASHSILSGCPMEPMPTGPPGTSHGRLHRLIWGPTELRAGWRLLIFACLIFTLRHGKQLLISNVLVGLDPDTLSVVGLLLALAVVFLATWIMGRFEGRTIAVYGLPWRQIFGRRFWLGVVCGFASITALLLVLRAMGVFSFGEPALHGRDIWIYAVLYALFMSSAPCGRNSIAGVTHFSRSRRGSASGLRRSAPRRILATCIISIPVKRRSARFRPACSGCSSACCCADRQSVDADRISCGLQLG